MANMRAPHAHNGLASPYHVPTTTRAAAKDATKTPVRVLGKEEKLLLGQLSALPDLQCAWRLLTRSAVPRMHYLLRTLAPTQSRPYAEARDELVWSTAVGLLQGQALPRDRLDEGWTVASLPGRLGGLGVRGA